MALELHSQGHSGGSEFDPVRAQGVLRHAPRLINFKGEPVQAPAAQASSAEQVAEGGAKPDLCVLNFRDPNYFVVEHIHEHFDERNRILSKKVLLEHEMLFCVI